MNSVAINIGVHIFLQIRVFSGYMPRSGIVGSYDIDLSLKVCYQVIVEKECNDLFRQRGHHEQRHK